MSKDTMVTMDTRRERLAALEHEQWTMWAGDIACTEAITPARLARWERLIATPYADLTEAEKDQDREWADRALALLDVEGQIAAAPSLALHLVGRALDARADALGRGQEARMCRTLATEAYRLRLAVVGAEYIESEGLE